MASWRDENENMDYTLRQVLKKIENMYDSKLSFKNDECVLDNDIGKELDEF